MHYVMEFRLEYKQDKIMSQNSKQEMLTMIKSEIF